MDRQKNKFYRAENHLLSKFPELVQKFDSFDEVKAWVTRITKSKWWSNYQVPVLDDRPHLRRQKSYGPIFYKSLKVEKTRSDCLYAEGDSGSIWLPKWAWSKGVILHEIAHAIQTEFPWHGKQFSRIYLDLVSRWIGREVASQIKQVFRKRRIAYQKIRGRFPKIVSSFNVTFSFSRKGASYGRRIKIEESGY